MPYNKSLQLIPPKNDAVFRLPSAGCARAGDK